MIVGIRRCELCFRSDSNIAMSTKLPEIIIRYINLGRILNMKRYEQFSFVISAICAFILLLNLVNVINLSSLINTLLTILTIVTIATFNIRNSKFIGLILYAIAALMLVLYLANELF